MKKYLAWDKELERINEVVAFNMRGFDDEYGDIMVKSEEEDNSSDWLPVSRFLLMERIGRKDIHEKELHEGAIVKFKSIRDIVLEKNADFKIGFIEYEEVECLYLIVCANDKIPLWAVEKIEKIGIMPMDSELLGF